MPSQDSMRFRDHFARLEQIAAKMQGAKDVDVDQLIEDVKRAVESHDYCEARIDGAIVELDKLLGRTSDAGQAD